MIEIEKKERLLKNIFHSKIQQENYCVLYITFQNRVSWEV